MSKKMKTNNGPPKQKIQIRTLFRLWKYLFEHKALFFIAMFLTVVSNLLVLTGPALAGKAVNAFGSGFGNVDFKSVIWYCILMLIFYILSSALSYVLSVVMINLSRNITMKMRKDLFDRLSVLPVRYFDGHQLGDIISRFSYDIDTVNSSLSSDLLQICTSVITVVGSLVMMISISPKLTLVFAVTVPVSIVMTKYMAGKVRPFFRARSGKLGELNGYAEEMMSGHKNIKAYRREDVIISRFDVRNKTAADAYFKADYYGSMVGPCVNFINNLSITLVSVFGAILFIAKDITLGNLSSFVLYSRKFSGPINEAANIISELQSACAAAERIFRLMDEEPEPVDSRNALTLSNVRGDVSMEHVKFGYDPEKLIIKNLDLDVHKGDLIAIVGPTGAGKTTIVNLLMRFYDIADGSIKIDENNIYNVTRASLRLSYAMVLQETWLFHGTVFENIAYGKKDATLDDVEKAARAAKIHDYILSLPKGYDTLLSDNGVNISQGQKQLMTIARAMLLDSSMLILDEATSNVDTKTEKQIQDAMNELMKGKTCFVIAHRLSTIMDADRILVVMDGEVAEQGRHSDLLKKNGVYAGLYNSQFQ